MFLSLLLSYLNRSASFTWSPAVNFDDKTVYSALIPGAHY
jgi:hypothetical protein